MKCWIKIKCLGLAQTGQLRSLLDALQKDNNVDIDFTSPNKTSRISGEIVVNEGAARSVSDQYLSMDSWTMNQPLLCMKHWIK